jgi:hypothetical protein
MSRRRKRSGSTVKVTITLFYLDQRGVAKDSRPHFGVRRAMREAFALLDCLESFEDGREARIMGDGSEMYPVGSVRIEPATKDDFATTMSDRSEEMRIADDISRPIGADGTPFDPRIQEDPTP